MPDELEFEKPILELENDAFSHDEVGHIGTRDDQFVIAKSQRHFPSEVKPRSLEFQRETRRIHRLEASGTDTPVNLYRTSYNSLRECVEFVRRQLGHANPPEQGPCRVVFLGIHRRCPVSAS